jgi:ribose transport system substrate-binding protein
MKKNSRISGLAAFAIVLSFFLLPGVLASAAGGSQKSGTKTIGFVPMTLSNDYFILMVNGAKAEAARQGVEVLVQASTTHANAEEQVRIIEDLIQKKVDAICVVPSSSASLTTVLKKAQDAKIPVINVDTILDAKILAQFGITPPPFEGTDNYAGAKLAGEYVAKTLFTGRVLNVVLLNGIPGQQNASDRRNGFVEGAGASIKVVAEQTANWEIEEAFNATQTILQANPRLDLVFAGSDTMALGALRAIQEVNRQNEIKVIGFDGSGDAATSIEAGGLLATVAQDPGKMGIIGVQQAVAAINGSPVPAKTDTGAQFITRDKIAAYKDYLKQFQN